MRIIESSVKLIEQGNTLIDMYKHIEKCARVCYKSENKITDTSYEGIIKMLTNNKHLSVLEHGTVYLYKKVNSKEEFFEDDMILNYLENPYSIVIRIRNNQDDLMGIQHAYITTNYRVLVENGWLNDLKYLCEPTEYHKKRYTFNVICSRGISHELVRHRAMSFSQESQRYVNYSKKGGITFIKPSVLKDVEIPEYPEYIDIANLRFKPFKFLNSWYEAEQTYNELLNFKYKPEIAREVLPNACKTELMITTDEDYLVNHFLPLRTTSTAHPDMQVLANMIKDCFENQIRSKDDKLQ